MLCLTYEDVKLMNIGKLGYFTQNHEEIKIRQ